MNFEELEHPRDLRAVIAAELAATPVDEVSLRRGVWAYVRAERDLGASPRSLVAVLAELVDASKFGVLSVRRSVMRWMIHSCVQAYFGHHADEVITGGDGAPSAHSVVTRPMILSHR